MIPEFFYFTGKIPQLPLTSCKYRFTSFQDLPNNNLFFKASFPGFFVNWIKQPDDYSIRIKSRNGYSIYVNKNRDGWKVFRSSTSKVEANDEKGFFTIDVQRGPPGFVGFQGPAGQRSFPGGKNWVPQEINYFDPFYDQKTTVIGGPMEHAGKYIYFRDMHIFVNLMNNIIVIKSDELMRNNFYICFKGKAFY